MYQKILLTFAVMKSTSVFRDVLFWVLAALLVLLFVPWLGDTLFNTKGEPREAIVALSMVQSGDYILPVSFGTDIAYKPPMLAWLIVGASWLSGGVTEFASRLPSALATIAMLLTVFAFFRREHGAKVGFMTALITATSFEVFRAATACRVDMVLTAAMVCAMICMYRGGWLRMATGVLLMSVAVLTKGPVGMVLPCLVVGVYRLLRGERFWPTFGKLALAGTASLVLPALWYAAAYERGGEVFLRLAMEENFGRMTGTMSYDSHVNPFYYNFITVASGMLPYTLLALFSLFAVKWAKPRWPGFRTLLEKARKADPSTLFSIVTTVVVFVFYCIPKSKRSVYLLPIYPFLGYFVTQLILWLIRRDSKALTVYGAIIGAVGLLISQVYLLILCGIPLGGNQFLQGIANADLGFFSSCLAFIPCAGLEILLSLKRPRNWQAVATLAVTYLIYLSLGAAYLPAVLNTKSDQPIARVIETKAPKESPVYMYVDDPMLRYYTVNFYLGDRLRLFEIPEGSATLREKQELPADGYVLVGEQEVATLAERYPGYSFEEVYRGDRKSCDTRRVPTLQRFSRR